MSVVIKTRKSKPKTWSTTVMWLVFGLAAIFFLVIYGQQLLLQNDLEQRIAVQRSENAALEDVNTRLKSSLLYFQSDKYIEQRAREDLNLRRPDEEVLIPIIQAPASPDTAENVAAVTGESTGTTEPDSMRTEQTAPNWLAWLSLFAPSSNTP